MKLKKIKTFILNNKITIATLILLIPLYIILYKIYIPKINAFGCFDDCNNFMRGYFFLNGSALFSEVFSGHQPLGSYLSALIQLVTSPENIFELILKHRQFVLVFSLLANALLIVRFGAKILLFTVIFEFSKFYIFGDRFLGDGMVVYLIIYMVGIVLKKIWKEKIYSVDYVLLALFSWFVIFMREPYVPLALLLFLIVLWSKPLKRVSVISFIIFTALSAAFIFAHDVGEYFFNVVVFNYQINLPAEVRLDMFGPRVLHWFFYPIYIFFYGSLNIFKVLLLSINLVFLVLFINSIRLKKFSQAILIFVVLGLANLRAVIPGSLFYSSFHMIVWFGLFVFLTIELLFREASRKKLFYFGFVILIVGFLVFISSPKYFGRENTDTHTEFINNYGYILQQGEAIKALSNPSDTLFLDGSDDLIYWQSGLFSSYKYSWYTSAMPQFEKYTDERLRMFRTDPPDFYREFGACPKDSLVSENLRLPEFVKDDYIRLHENNRPSCIYIHKRKLTEITQKQLDNAEEFLYTLPDEKIKEN